MRCLRNRRLFLLAMLAWLAMAFGAHAMPCGAAAACMDHGLAMDHGMAMTHGAGQAQPDGPGHAQVHGACTCAVAGAVAGVPLSSLPANLYVASANLPTARPASVGDFPQTPLLRPPSA